MAISEVAQLRERIENEYRAAMWGLCGLAYGTTKHDFINARMENIETGHQKLAALVGEQQATVMVVNTLHTIPEKPERQTIVKDLEHIRGNTEEVEILIGYIRSMWETIDLLEKEFGEEDARKIITAPGCNYLVKAECGTIGAPSLCK